MAPLVWIGTVLTHFTGGSAGREGTALQMSAAIFSAYVDMLNKRRNVFSPDMQRAMIVAALASGFSGIFGVPVTGTIFSVEVLRVCTMMGVELFGGAKPLCFFTACFLAYLFSNIRKIGGIYDRQRPPNKERSSNDHLRSWLP